MHQAAPDQPPPTYVRPRGPLPGILGGVASMLYSLAIRRINARYDAGRGVVTLDRPVISIGNLSVGGTGKSPMTAFVVQTLLDAGHRPCIAMRGYRAKHGQPSDEESEHSRAFPRVPIVSQKDRIAGLLDLFARQNERDGPAANCVVLDDGFQHRKIARQLDVVLLDATRNPFHDRLLPAGWLREPVDSLRRAGFFVITHTEAVRKERVLELREMLRLRFDRIPVAECSHVWVDLRIERTGLDGETVSLPTSALKGKRVFAVCAIGNPMPFLLAAEKATGIGIAGSMILPDHDAYSSKTIQCLVREAKENKAEYIVTTEKDWSKLRRVKPEIWPSPVVRPRLSLRFDSGERRLIDAVTSTASLSISA